MQLSYLVIFKSERRIVYIVLLSLLLYFYIILFFSCFVPFFQSQVFFLPLTLKLLLQVNFPAERSMRSILSYLKFLCSGANEGLSYFIFTAFHIEKSNLNTKKSNHFAIPCACCCLYCPEDAPLPLKVQFVGYSQNLKVAPKTCGAAHHRSNRQLLLFASSHCLWLATVS